MLPFDKAFLFLKRVPATWRPEDETGEFQGLRLLPTEDLPTAGEALPLTDRNSGDFESKLSDVGFDDKTVPGFNEGEDIAGTWMYPNSLKPLQKPDIGKHPSANMSLLGSYAKPDFWRKQPLAPYGEGFKYWGVPTDEMRRVDLPKATNLGDIRAAAHALLQGKAPKDFYNARQEHPASENTPAVHSILEGMNLPEENYWEGNPVSTVPKRITTHNPLDDDMSSIIAAEPMEIAMRLLKTSSSLYPTGLRLPSGMMANTFYDKHLKGRGGTARPEQIGVKRGPVTNKPEGSFPGQHNLQYHSPKHRAIVENTSYLSRGKDFDYGRVPIPEEKDMRSSQVIDTEFDEDVFEEDKEAANQFGATPNAYHYRGVNYPKIEETYTPDDMYEMFSQKSEPMEIAMRLLKERMSPEAKRHKLEYDTEYESSPERVKYREDLNRERRRRGMYGDHSHRDISHTEGNKLTVENEHSNRARHFKGKGTLRKKHIRVLKPKQPQPNNQEPIPVEPKGDHQAYTHD